MIFLDVNFLLFLFCLGFAKILESVELYLLSALILVLEIFFNLYLIRYHLCPFVSFFLAIILIKYMFSSHCVL